MLSALLSLFASRKPPTAMYYWSDGTLHDKPQVVVAAHEIRNKMINDLRTTRDYHSIRADHYTGIADDANNRRLYHERNADALNEALTRLTNPEWFAENGISGRDDAEHWALDMIAKDIVAMPFHVETKHYGPDEALSLAEELQKSLEGDFIGNTGLDLVSVTTPKQAEAYMRCAAGYDPKPRYTGDDADFVSPNEPIDPELLDALRAPDDNDGDPLLDDDEAEHDRAYGVEK